jgi:hypothetical protein
MKTWRKLIWLKNQSKVFVSLRLSELLFAGVKIYEPCKYKTSVKNGKIILEFRQ